MRVLVTGAAGFIGFHVSRHLLARGDTVLGIHSLNDYYDVTLKHARLAELDKDGGNSNGGFTFKHVTGTGSDYPISLTLYLIQFVIKRIAIPKPGRLPLVYGTA